jgi:hypothetical protein
MIPSSQNLAQIRKDLKDAIIAKLKDAMQPGGSLQDVKNVLYGNRAKIGQVNPPIAWVIPDTHVPDVSAHSRAWHNFNFDIIGVIKNIDPELGADQAEDLAARIYDVIMADRKLGGLVHDITPTGVNPAYEAGQNTQLHWAAVSFSFRIPRVE